MITHCKLKLLNSLLFMRMYLKHKIICGTAFEAQGLCGTASVLHGFVKVTFTINVVLLPGFTYFEHNFHI